MLKDEFLDAIERLEELHDEVLDDDFLTAPVRDELLAFVDQAEEELREGLRLFNES